VQDGIRRPVDRLRAPFAGGRAEQRQPLGGAAAHILMGLPRGIAAALPRAPGLRNGLAGSGLILTPQLQPARFRDPVGAVDYLFLGVARGSWTSTTVPSRRRRRAMPVWHQVRCCCQVYPASHSTARIVAVLTSGK